MTEHHPFTWRHFAADIILLCVRWYLRYALSYRDLEEMMRALDSQGHPLEFCFSPTRDAQAAKRFLLTTLTVSQSKKPRVINVDTNAASPKAFCALQAGGVLPEAGELRPVKLLDQMVEQDHRLLTRLIKPGRGLLFT